MGGRLALTMGSLAASLAGWISLRSEAIIPQAPLLPQTPSIVDVAKPLPGAVPPDSSSAAAILIIGSLGNSHGSYRVRLTLDPQSNSAVLPIRAVQWAGSAESTATVFKSKVQECALPDRGSSPVPAPPATADADGPTDRVLHLHVADLPLEDRRGYVRIRASVCLEGRLVRVYRDTQLDSDTSLASLAQEVVRLLDERIIPRSRELLGTHDDVDGDGKLAVLLTPWLGRLQGGSTSVNGFVRSGDFDEHLEPPYGNRGDILYLNSDLRADSSLVATLTHEYTHAVVCSRRRPVGCRTSGMQPEPDWLNEAIAHVAESQQEAGWSNLDRRVVAFLERPHGTALAVEDYYRSGLWRDPASRGAAFLFLLWCSERFGERLLSQLVEHPRAGIPKLEAITGERFADLFRQWTIAVAAGQVGPLCLTESLGDCPLKGPRVIEWPADQDSLELDVKGTAAAYVRLPAERSNGRHVAIAADDDAQLQATILVRTSAGR